MTEGNTLLIIIVSLAVFLSIIIGVWIWFDFFRVKPTQETGAVVKEGEVNQSTTESQVKKGSKTMDEETQQELDGNSPTTTTTSSTTMTKTVPTSTTPIYLPPSPIHPPSTNSQRALRTTLKLPMVVMGFKSYDLSDDPIFLEQKYEELYKGAEPYNKPPQFHYYFGKDCPKEYEDLGRAGVLRPKSAEPGYPFEDGEAFNSQWVWTHPRLCKGRIGSTKKNLYGLTDYRFGTIPGRLLLGNNFFKKGSEPLDLEKYNDRWSWADIYFVPTTETSAISLSDKSVKSTSHSDITSSDGIGILFAKDDLDNIKDIIDIGESYDDKNTWIHPDLYYVVESDI